ncbi:hypothetical protein V2K16_25950 [Pseudomonas alliivorans]|nr:hypothetical protein [Pseudomonas alliivorans]MEE4881765.1 hypothetical protein [Pseudomonas alliivorans]MEE4933125.1 hypothetical protein [Pseudomonas alliivorans]MEE4938331.1 hypothetical protein [Pseudomonas alliivorans]MEE4943572.1 hypothetical protein [Pseudomonas alliivorans]MEE4954105.1 hypothetical protein [Pseudomonas alliivorans]
MGRAEIAAAATDGAHAGAEGRNAQTDTKAEALFIHLVGVGVLQTFDVQIAADVCDDLLATRYRAFDPGVELKAGKV